MKRRAAFTQDLLPRAPRQNSPGQKSAFTMIELIIVIAIMSALAGLLLPGLNRARQRAKIANCITTIGSLKTALAMYSLDYGLYPPSATAATQRNGNSSHSDLSGSPNNLVNALTAIAKSGPYMEFRGKDLDETQSTRPVLLDPWGNAYIYVSQKDINLNDVSDATEGPFHPSESSPEKHSNTYNIYSLGPDKQTDDDANTGGEINYSGASDWDESQMYDDVNCGHWNDSAIGTGNARYDDINSWDGARSG